MTKSSIVRISNKKIVYLDSISTVTLYKTTFDINEFLVISQTNQINKKVKVKLSYEGAVLHLKNMLHNLSFPVINTCVCIGIGLFNLVSTLITRISRKLWMTRCAKIQWRLSEVGRGTKKISWATFHTLSTVPAFPTLPARPLFLPIHSVCPSTFPAHTHLLAAYQNLLDIYHVIMCFHYLWCAQRGPK